MQYPLTGVWTVTYVNYAKQRIVLGFRYVKSAPNLAKLVEGPFKGENIFKENNIMMIEAVPVAVPIKNALIRHHNRESFIMKFPVEIRMMIWRFACIEEKGIQTQKIYATGGARVVVYPSTYGGSGTIPTAMSAARACTAFYNELDPFDYLFKYNTFIFQDLRHMILLYALPSLLARIQSVEIAGEDVSIHRLSEQFEMLPYLKNLRELRVKATTEDIPSVMGICEASAYFNQPRYHRLQNAIPKAIEGLKYFEITNDFSKLVISESGVVVTRNKSGAHYNAAATFPTMGEKRAVTDAVIQRFKQGRFKNLKSPGASY